jgi:hypothetical protein
VNGCLKMLGKLQIFRAFSSPVPCSFDMADSFVTADVHRICSSALYQRVWFSQAQTL